MQSFRAGGKIGKRAFGTRHVSIPRPITAPSRFSVPASQRRYQSSTNGPLKPSPWTAHTLNSSHSSPIDSSDISKISRRLNKHQKHVAYIALGSNLGDRVGWIEKACNMMQKKGIEIKRTSGLWETEPMYVEDQNLFLNGAAEVETVLEPIALLDALQSIENELGRKKVIDKGPRNIDLDILLYDDQVIDHERLKVPHPLMYEREFVLRPLAELIPGKSLNPAQPWKVTQDYLNELPPSPSPISTVTPMPGDMKPLRALDLHRTTRVMAILNATPDSFSDGGKMPTKTDPRDYPNLEPLPGGTSRPVGSLFSLTEDIDSHHRKWGDALLTEAVGKFDNETVICDIGGQSTAPGVKEVSAEEETRRVLLAIEEINDAYGPEHGHILCKPYAFSVDTYRATVAEAAIEAGASIINDVSAGTMDPEMLPTMARLGVTVVLMHMRGTPQTMSTLTSYPSGLIPTIASELLERVAAAEAAGIRRWRIILDPGIGFAKTAKQNVEILGSLEELREWPGLRGLPWLVGSSRKGFIGRITGVERPDERGWGTAATVAAAVQGGADVVRVHDVKEMEQVVKVADAIWRGYPDTVA